MVSTTDRERRERAERISQTAFDTLDKERCASEAKTARLRALRLAKQPGASQAAEQRPAAE